MAEGQPLWKEGTWIMSLSSVYLEKNLGLWTLKTGCAGPFDLNSYPHSFLRGLHGSDS